MGTILHGAMPGSVAPFDWQDYEDGEHRLTCTACGRGKHDKTLGLKVRSDGAVAHCFRCGYVESFRLKRSVIRRQPCIKPQRQNEPKRTTLSDWGRSLWESTLELSGAAVAYLEHRRCIVPPVYGDLRWHPALKHPSGYVGAALVALITDIHTNQALSLHRTWITATGKADVNQTRLLLANHAIENGAIKLWPAEDVGHTLGIAEGVETALSLAHCVQPVWSCIDAGHLGKFPLIAGITQLGIAQDQDPAGQKAATATAQRWTDDGRIVWVSQQQQNDVNDEVTA